MNTDGSKPARRADKKNKQNRKNREWKWIASIFAATFVISGCFSFASNSILQNAGICVAFIVLLFIVLLGILFDLVGVAVTAAASDPAPFHSMASRRVQGAKESLLLLKNAGRVASFCNDVIGDICGVVSGSAAAAIAVFLIPDSAGAAGVLVPLLLSALVAAFTVGGKAIGKTFALRQSTQIVLQVGCFLHFFNCFK